MNWCVPLAVANSSALFIVSVLLRSELAGLAAEAQPASEHPVLTRVAQVRDLPPSEAGRGFPVRLRGIVTYHDGRDYKALFLQDETAGIYVDLYDDMRAEPGERVELEGTSSPGHFAPVIRAAKLTHLGHGPMPLPRPVSFEQLATGKQDSQWVEVRGVVRSVTPATHGRVHMDLVMSGHRLRMLVTHPDIASAEHLIGAGVRVRGVCFARFNQKRQLLAPWLGVNSLQDIAVEQPAPERPIEVPAHGLLQFTSPADEGHRVKVQGVVTHQQPGRSLFIREANKALYIKTQQTNALQPGDRVEVLGFPALGQYTPLLEDGVFKRVGSGPPFAPVKVTPEQILSGEYDADLVRIEARLVDRAQRPDEEVLVLEAGNFIFNAQMERPRGNTAALPVKNGSRVELTGICLVQPLENWKPRQNARAESFRILLRTPQDIAIVQPPSWWTLRHFLWALGAMTVIVLAALAWVIVLRRRVAEQTEIIAQKLRREAAFEERTRIAREFHDTLEQELVGITLQLDAVAARWAEAPAAAGQCLDLARSMSRRSLSEFRRSVWDLRSQLLESGDLPSAFSEVLKRLQNGSPARLELKVCGTPRRLPGRVENHLLRIGQEAVHNAVKHAQAKTIQVELTYASDKVRLKIRDDGIGFAAEPCASAVTVR